tara:strand:- start:9600 stop:13730 length:4131 start_codon:yes stop_codon:yes gene_type:complete
MGDVLVKSRADSEAEKRAEAEASFEDKEDPRGLPKPKALKDMTDKEKEALKREGLEEGGGRVGVTEGSAETAFEDLGITRTTPTKIREDDDDEETFTSTTGYEERDRKRLEEALENAKQQLAENPDATYTVTENGEQVQKPLSEKISQLESNIENIQPDFVPDPSKRRKVAVKEKPKLSRRERAMVENEGRLQEVAEMQGVDFDLAQKKALNAIKDLANQQGIPIPPPGALRAFGPMEMNPEYKKLLDDNYKRILGDIIVGKVPTAMMRDSEGKLREIEIRPTKATGEALEDELRDDRAAQDKALVAIARLQEEKEDAEEAGDSDRVAVLQSQIEEEAQAFPDIQARPKFGESATGQSVREQVAEKDVSAEKLRQMAQRMGSQFMSEGEEELSQAQQRDAQIDKLESELNEPYIMAGDGEGNINPTHSLYIKTRRDAQDLLAAATAAGRQDKIEEAQNALVNLNRRLEEKGRPQMRSVPAGLGGTISQTPQGLDISTDIAEPIPAREFFRRMINPRMTAGGRGQGQRGTGQTVEGGFVDAQKRIAGLNTGWDFSDDPLFMQVMSQYDVPENIIPTMAKLKQGQYYGDPRAKSKVRGLRGLGIGRGRLDEQEKVVRRAMGDAMARFMANHVATPEGAMELLGPEYAAFMTKDHPELGDLDAERKMKKLEKLTAERTQYENKLALSDPEKIREMQEKRAEMERQKQEAMIGRAVQTMAENMALNQNHNKIVRGRLPGLGQGGKSIQEMKEEQVLLREAVEAAQTGDEDGLGTSHNRLVNKYGYSPESLDADMLERQAMALDGTIEHLSNERKRLIADVDSMFRDTMIRMQRHRQGARGQRPFNIDVPDELPLLDTDPDVPKKERGFNIDAMQAQMKVAEERGDTELAAKLKRRIKAARQSAAGGETMSELEDKLREAEASGNQATVDKVLDKIRRHRKEITTFNPMPSAPADRATSTRIEYPEAPPAIHTGGSRPDAFRPGELIEEVMQYMQENEPQLNDYRLAGGIRREFGKEPIEMSNVERLAAARRTKEGHELLTDAMGDIGVFDREGETKETESIVPEEGDFGPAMGETIGGRVTDVRTRGSVGGKERRLEQFGDKPSATPDKASGFEGDKAQRPTFGSKRQRFLQGGIDMSKLVGEGGTSDEKTMSALANMYGPEEILNVLNNPRVQAVSGTGAYTAASHREKMSMIQDALAGNLTAEDLQPAAPPAPPAPEPVAPPAPASAAPADSGFAGEPPSPLSALQQGAEPVNIFQQQPPPPTPEPMDSTTEQQSEVAGVAPQPMDFGQPAQPAQPAAQVTQTPGVDMTQAIQQAMANLTPEQQNALRGLGLENMSLEEIMQMVSNVQQKSEPMQRFDSTVGDDLLKSIKDRFWRQGY